VNARQLGHEVGYWIRWALFGMLFGYAWNHKWALMAIITWLWLRLESRDKNNAWSIEAEFKDD
jgi:hypothetical protein